MNEFNDFNKEVKEVMMEMFNCKFFTENIIICCVLDIHRHINNSYRDILLINNNCAFLPNAVEDLITILRNKNYFVNIRKNKINTGEYNVDMFTGLINTDDMINLNKSEEFIIERLISNNIYNLSIIKLSINSIKRLDFK
jgi:hypothetical protein